VREVGETLSGVYKFKICDMYIYICMYVYEHILSIIVVRVHIKI